MCSEQACYTLINLPSDSEPPSEHKLKEDLQNGDVKAKTEALKKVIRMIINGEKFQSLLMTVIRFVMPLNDHTIKKLLLLFWEVVPKYSSDGKLLHEMILVCDAYRKDLQHPNEYIRGSTLRFLCKLKEPELLEPLMPAIQQCLEHRHSYVRRNAVLAIFTIYKNFDFLIPDAPEKIAKFLEQEQDASCKRNAFMMLLHADQERALNYLSTCLDQVHTFGDILQLVIVELIYKVCHTNPSERSRFIRCVYNLLQSSSPAVRYEAASTLITLSNAPTAIKAVASCYIDLILKESDNNVKIIVLDRLMALRENHEKILQDLVMDIMRILGASDLDVRKKTLDLSLVLLTSRTAEELVNILRKELVKVCASTTNSTSTSKDEKTYRYYLVHTIYQACMRYPEMISNVVPSLCEILTYEEDCDNSGQGAGEEVCRFLREAIQRFEHLKSMILEKIMEYYPNIQSKIILRHTMWILGEFCTSLEEINAFMILLRQILGPIPIVDDELRRISGETCEESVLMSADGGVQAQSSRKVTADGTYATQSALTSYSATKRSDTKVKRPILQAALFSGDYMPAVVLSCSLVKLYSRYAACFNEQQPTSPISIQDKLNGFAAECMLIIASMIHLGKTDLIAHTINPDHFDRMWFCLKALSDRTPRVLEIFDTLCREKLVEMVHSQEEERKKQAKKDDLVELSMSVAKKIQADDPVRFLQLQSQNDLGELEDRFDVTMSQALGSKEKANIFSSSKLNKVTQLTGFSDPIYAEAYVHVNQYDIVLDILIVNQTSDTLQNLTVELATLGDLKLVEKPTPLTMAPRDFANIKANIKVSSSENGIIFGNIVYDVRGSSGECNCVVLNDIHIDIMEYIMPASCKPNEYRQMWNEFEWENKVTVNTKISNLRVYLEHILKHTNMRCLTPAEALQGECDYLCITLYAKSIFGEHVLANLCLERPPGDNEPVTGHVRIRAKTQGMAVTMGEKISATQKQNPEDKKS